MKAFQLNANARMGDIVTKFEHVQVTGPGTGALYRGPESEALYRDPFMWTDRRTDTTKNINQETLR